MRVEPAHRYNGSCSPVPAPYVLIKPGTFIMGSPDYEPGRENYESPVHEVTISHAFFLKATEVTQGERIVPQWKALTGNNSWWFQNCGESCPVEMMSWWVAVAYCNELSKKEGLEQCYTLSRCSGTPSAGDVGCSGVTFAGVSCTGEDGVSMREEKNQIGFLGSEQRGMKNKLGRKRNTNKGEKIMRAHTHM